MIRHIFLIFTVLLLFVSCSNGQDLENEIHHKDKLIDSLNTKVVELKKDKSQILKKILSEKILSIAVLLAQQINGDDLEVLLDRYPEKDDIKNINDDTLYFEIHKKLKLVYDRCESFSNITILVYNQQKDVYEFIAVNSSHPYWRHEYDEIDPEFKDRYSQSKPGYGVLPQITDENAEWISAFHEIVNSEGERVGILQSAIDIGFYKYMLED